MENRKNFIIYGVFDQMIVISLVFLGSAMKLNLNILALDEWWDEKLPLIISGPCSAESEQQLLETATAVSKISSVKVFRAGLWKPRTRPGAFEGAGQKAFTWLKKVKSETGLKIAVEIATAGHVKECLGNDIDMIWIGARTVVNPFSVQEIANELEKSNIPVLIKNPVSPDLNLWIGAIERINSAGIKKIIAVHRGFNRISVRRFRNDPLWEIPIEMKRLFPDLPLICDPSHIAGKKGYVREISQKAFNIGIEGLMIESHIDPENALTDTAQQLSPSELEELLDSLEFRNTMIGDKEGNKLRELREKIDNLDEEFLKLLSTRMQFSRDIATIKKKLNMSALQMKRWNEILEDRIKFSKDLGLDEDFIIKIMEQVHKESIRAQYNILKKKAK